MTPARRVVVTGLGVVCPIGLSPTEAFAALLAGQSGITHATLQYFEQIMGVKDESIQTAYDWLPSKVVGAVDRSALFQTPFAPHRDDSRHTWFQYFALTAAAQALNDAKYTPTTPKQQHRTGVCIGVGLSDLSELHRGSTAVHSGKPRSVSPFFIPKILPNSAAGAVSIAHGLRGPNHAPSTACASGLHGVGDAFAMIQRGDAEVMLAGGSEAPNHALSFASFSRMRGVATRFNDSPTSASRPFDADRDGFVIGEGAGMLVLEELYHAQERGAGIYAEVVGYGMSGDAYHVSAPHPDGLGASLAIRAALCSEPPRLQRGADVSEVGYINAHATGTPKGDEAEQKAICSVFDEAGCTHKVLVGSTKGSTGHLLGAAGAVEAVFTVLALKTRKAPVTCNLVEPTPWLCEGLLTQGRGVQTIREPVALCNSFGFGGTNACVAFRAWEA